MNFTGATGSLVRVTERSDLFWDPTGEPHPHSETRVLLDIPDVVFPPDAGVKTATFPNAETVIIAPTTHECTAWFWLNSTTFPNLKEVYLGNMAYHDGTINRLDKLCVTVFVPYSQWHHIRQYQFREGTDKASTFMRMNNDEWDEQVNKLGPSHRVHSL